jgi:sterol desaturase/sphingolipid hydroxylase (fatty acid hydroxylase superfamily)
MLYATHLAAAFLVWTLWSYAVHVAAHSRLAAFRPLRRVHRAHHAVRYGPNRWPTWPTYLLWFGSWRATLDVLITFTAPLIGLSLVAPRIGVPLLVFHYIYEVFLAGSVLDHNPVITGPITQVVAIGAFHMRHHASPSCNFGFYVTAWDRLFRTARTTAEPAVAVLRSGESGLSRRASAEA